MPKLSVILILALLLLAVFSFTAEAASVSYEIYTIKPGDTPENLAARQGLSTDEIVSIDQGAWEPGRRVALFKRYSNAPAKAAKKASASAKKLNTPYMASVVKDGCEIRSEVNGGEFLFKPDKGGKVVVVSETPTHYGLIMANLSTGWIEKSAVSLDTPLESDWLDKLLAGGSKEVVQEAFRYLGLPYRYGGRLPYNTDCSLLVQTVFSSKGMRLPRTAAEQSRVGTPVAQADIAAGDRLYFINSKGVIGHTGIYIGGGRFIHASSNKGCVAVDYLAGHYMQKLAAIRR